MKYWAYVNNEILGPYEKEKLFEIPDFSPATLLCPQTPAGEKTEDWKEAASYPEVSAFLNSPHSALKKEFPKENLPQEDLKPLDSIPAQEKNDQIQEDLKPDDTTTTQETSSLNQLKPQTLTPSSIGEQQEQSKMEPSGAFEVNKLSPLKKEEPKETPSQEFKPQGEPEIKESEEVKSSDSRFDPLSLSQIGKNIHAESIDAAPSQETPFSEEDKKETQPIIEKDEPQSLPPENAAQPIIEKNESQSLPPENAAQPIIEKNESQSLPAENAAQPIIEKNEPPQEKFPEIAPAKEPENLNKDSNIKSQEVSEIHAKLDNLSQNIVSKNDISAYMAPIDAKLSQIDKTIANLENTKLESEIKEMSGKLKHMEDVIDEIKLNMSIKQNIPAPSAKEAEPLKEETQTVFSTMEIGKTERVSGEQLQKELEKTGVEPIKESAKEEKPIDDSKDDSKEKKIPIAKKLIKSVLTVFIIVAVLITAAIALKKAGIMDITRIIPIPFLTESKSPPIKTATPVKAQPPIKQIPVQEERDLKPEIIFFTKTFSGKSKEKTLENQIIKQAAKEKGHTDLIKWEALKISEKIYKVNAIVPLAEGFKITYKFETDYAAKIIKPLNVQGKTAFKSLFETVKPKKQRPAKKKITYRKKRKPAPVPKKIVVKEQEPENDDEYEYVDEEEEEFEDENYLLPGIPSLGD